MAVILRRRKLGRTSCREIARLSQEGIVASRNDQPFPPGHDLVFRWGTTSNLDIRNVVNTARAIHEVNEKREFRRVLNERGLCPATWFNFRDTHITYPCVVRPAVHAQGRRLYVANNFNELEAAVGRCGAGYYISALINKVAEYRVFCVQGRVACVAQKTPGNPDEVAWNVARGGRFDNLRWGEWNLRAVRIALEAFNCSNLDFGGVDIMVDADNRAYVLEINSAPSLTSPYRQECMAKCFDWIVRNGKQKIPLTERKGGWRKFIHPAVSEEAITV